ncbi:LOW QUALITY PROTEIN: RAD51-associated protein 2 [Caloenas nicobarica]|uniref:LOW QUALITY PROTEIN: RAD51-associated protein 2 n=1 Tax=Caloenas nicobarica TaxID=187106 RepID=UPI0032B73A7B
MAGRAALRGKGKEPQISTLRFTGVSCSHSSDPCQSGCTRNYRVCVLYILETVKRLFMPNALLFLTFRTVSASIELIFVSMENTCSERFSSASSDEAEWYLYPKRIKIEGDQKNIEKEEQQKLEQSLHCMDRYETSPHEPTDLSERQNSWAVEKQSCDTARKTCMREFFHFQTCSSERFPCRVSETELPTKKWSPENENQITMEDGISLNVHGQPPETEVCHVWNAGNTRKNLQVLNTPQAQQNNNIEYGNKINDDNKFDQNSSVTPFNRDLFQMELLNHRSVSDKKWKQFQLLQIPFFCGTSSVFSCIEHEKNNFLTKVCNAENKGYSSSDSETTTERDNKEKDISSSIVPTLKPFKRLQLMQIPKFQFSSISNKMNSKMPPNDLEEMDWKNFKDQPSLIQSKQVNGVQKVSETGKQKLKNAKSSVKASIVDSEFKEKYYPLSSKQEYSPLAEGGRVSGTYSRGNSADIECNRIFAENYLKCKMLENSDGDDDQKSRILIYISAKNIQKDKCVSNNVLLKRIGRKSTNSNESVAAFHIQTSIPVTREALEKNELDMHCGVRNSNSDLCLYEAESKLSTKEILDFKRCFTKNIIFESSCPHTIVQHLPDTKVSFNIFKGKEMFQSKFSFQNTLLRRVRTWSETLYKDMPTCLGDGVTQRFHFCETLNEQCDAEDLVKSNISMSQNNKIGVCLLAIISKHLKVEVLKTILASFFNSRNTSLQAEGKSTRVEKHPLCGRMQVQLNSCTDIALRQNTEFHKKHETYPCFVSSKFLEHIGFELQSEYQRRHFSRSLGEEESTFLKRGTLFHHQKSGLCQGRHVRKHHLLPRGSGGFSTCLGSVSHKNSMKRQILVAKCLILLQGTFHCSSVDKMYCCNITKMQYLIGAQLRFWNYFPAHSQLKFEKLNSKGTNLEILVTTVKQKKKPSKMFSSSFHRKSLRALPFVLYENKKAETTECGNYIKPTNEVTDEATYTIKKYLGTSSFINADQKECPKSEKLQINSDNFLSKKSFSIFDIYEKIPLTADSEDFDQIPVVSQENSVKKKSEENTVTSSKEVHNLPTKSNDVLILPEPSKPTMEKCNSLLLQDSQTNEPEYCKKIEAYSPHLASEKLENQNTYLNFENVFPGSSSLYQSVPLPLDSRSFVNKDEAVSEDGHSSSADKQKQSEKMNAVTQYPSTGSPGVTNTRLELQAKETVQFFSQGHTQTNEAVSLEPAALKRHLEYVKEQEEISDEQMHVTNESQCETVMNDLIMSYSEDESKTFIAAEEKLKMHLSIMNNGCLEVVKDKYLPLENKITCELELKRKFDLVLEELHMFHEISKGNENNLSSLETNSHNYCELNNSEGIDENVTRVSQKKACISSSVCGTVEGQNITDSNEISLTEKKSNDNEDQKLSKEYCISRLSSEDLLHSPIAEGYFDAAYDKPYTWNPAFLSCTLLREQKYNLQKEAGYFLSHEVMRVQPLKTCKGPIRIGLSRKARLKQLHPYLK